MKNVRIYTIFDLYEKIENLKPSEKIWVSFDELSTKEFRYLDQSYFIECIPNKKCYSNLIKIEKHMTV
jgi:hypothetical protein